MTEKGMAIKKSEGYGRGGEREGGRSQQCQGHLLASAHLAKANLGAHNQSRWTTVLLSPGHINPAPP